MPENNERNDLPIEELPEDSAVVEDTAVQEAGSEKTEENTVEETVEEHTVADNSTADDSADESAADDSAEDKSTDEYDEFEDEEYDEDNLAAVAERIMGARHTVAATAAPVRIRDATGHIPTVPKPTSGIPVRQSAAGSTEDNTENTSAPDNAQDGKSNKKMFTAVVASAVALIAVLSALIIVVNGINEKNRPADINMGETFGEAEILTPDETPADTDKIDTIESEVETDEPESTDETPEETDEPVQETESEPETETEPETEPAPAKFTVTLDFYDREDITIVTEAITFADLLTSIECTLSDTDVPSVEMNSMIAADTTVTIGKLEYKTETVTETIAYETEVIEIDTIPRGTTNYLQYGENGEITYTYTVEYLNGVEQKRTLAGEQTTKWPVNEKYELGVGGEFVGADGVTYTYSYRRVVPATYYNIEGLTYLGTMADESVIAVDRSYIPLGTRLYVKNEKYDFGVRIASDVGSAIKEWEIDIWIDDSNPQLEDFAYVGYHYDMEIYYID